MKIFDFADSRAHKSEVVSADVVVIGGGLSGVCAAIAAARTGASVALIGDRPVLGGNASSEVRVWVLGATSHMGNNNRWSREGGIIDEILLENLYRNKEGNPLFFDMVVMDKVLAEKNISLFLNTAVYEVFKSDKRNISHVRAFNAQNSTLYDFEGKIFVDASGDGCVGYSAGAGFRIGSETSDEHGELFAPDKEYGEILGHSIFFYTKQCAEEVKFVAPDFAIKDAEKHIPKLTNPNYFNVEQHGCKYWWLEYGGRLDTIGDTEQIKHKLWSVVYGVWDYIKNSGKFPQTANQTLEWVGAISGKRESRRFYGLYDLVQQDIIEQRTHYDAVAYGGWSIDLHPADAVFSELNGCNQWHSKGVYQIPYRSYVCRDIDNMFLCGRNISATHVAHASSRVMCTAAHGGQAVGVAAALCVQNNLQPKDYTSQDRIKDVQKILLANGQYIPNLDGVVVDNMLYDDANITTSSCFEWDQLLVSEYRPINDSVAQVFPLKGKLPKISFRVLASEPTELRVELRGSLKRGNFTPDKIIDSTLYKLSEGENICEVDFDYSNPESEYLFLTIFKNEKVSLAFSDTRLSGTLAVYNTINPAVSNYGKQTPPSNIGVEAFEFWCPKRWYNDANVALSFSPALYAFSADNLLNREYRPVASSNAWVASINEDTPVVTIKWQQSKVVSELIVFFDGDSDQALENNQMGHRYNRVPQCVDSFSVMDADDNIVAQIDGNHQARCKVKLSRSIQTDTLKLKFNRINPQTPVSVLGIIIN